MSTASMSFPSAEGVLLIRRDGVTMAIRMREVTAFLEPVFIDHPDLHLGYATIYGGTSLDHYAVDAQGKADRLYVWQGPDPFAQPELDAARPAVEG